MAKLRCMIQMAAGRPAGDAARRSLAAVLAVVLVLASAGPAWARTAEAEAEGEGSAPPGTLPGLEAGPELEGEETVLGEEPPLAGEEGEEEVVVPVEPEAPDSEPAAPAPVEEPQPEVAVAPEVTPPAPAPAPSAAPAYEAVAPPSYETETAAPAVVHGEAIVAPAAPQQSGQGGPAPAAAHSALETAPVVEAPPPAAPPVEAPEPAPAPPAMPPAEAAAAPGTLQGHRLHTVRPGESLWSIATALLPPGAGDAEIASEVQRLWQLNAARIGTGDPNLILVGTVMRLH